MVPNPDPDTDETKERILQAAMQVFVENGYAGATTRAIAAVAEVNEVTIFRRFGSKDGLFEAVLDRFSALPDFASAFQSQLTGEYRQDMLALGGHLMRVFVERQQALHLALCEASRISEMRGPLVQMPRRLRQMFAAYFQSQIDAGRIRDLNAEVMAQAFIGIFFSYHMLQTIFADPIADGLSQEELVAQFVDLFIEGTIIPAPR
jgi:AcrR family transcriptional regulator